MIAEGGHLAGMSRLSHLVLPHHENILIAKLWLLVYVGVANDVGLPHQGLRGRRLYFSSSKRLGYFFSSVSHFAHRCV